MGHDEPAGRGLSLNPTLVRYLSDAGWPAARQHRIVTGLRVLQDLARGGDQPVTYAEFAERVQTRLAPLATGSLLETSDSSATSQAGPT